MLIGVLCITMDSLGNVVVIYRTPQFHTYFHNRAINSGLNLMLSAWVLFGSEGNSLHFFLCVCNIRKGKKPKCMI